jgi:enamine deaminase RidA (YjgF/YER057c/UK114 family)
MEELFETNYPARAMIEVSALPMNANIEIEAIGYIPFR